jgi:tetratricopeptide (TPR) repeat protein
MRPPVHISVLCGLALVLYANTLGHRYAFDDAVVITRNADVQKGIAGIPALLSTDTISGFLRTETRLSGGRYRPLSLVTFAVEKSLWGDRPALSHAINLLLYAATGVLLYLLLVALAGEERRPLAFLASLLFLAHPLHTEVVANIKGRDELLMFALALGSGLLVLRRHPIVGGLVFFLALMAKENAITLLAVLPAALVVCQREQPRKAFQRTLPWLFAALIFVGLRVAIVGFIGDRGSSSLLNDPFAQADSAAKFATIALTLGRYLYLLLIPHPLICDYSYNQVPLVGWGHPIVLLSLLAHLALIVVGLRKRGVVGLLILYYFATLSIVSNIVFPVGVAMAERFLYLPSLAACVGLAALLLRIPQRIMLPLASIILLAASARTIHRNLAWKDDWTLFSCDVRKAPNNARMQLAYGEHALRREQLPEAVAALERSVAIYPAANSYMWLARAQTAAEDWPAVLASTEAGLAKVESLPQLHALRGKALLRSERKPQSLRHYARARELGDASIETRQTQAYLMLDLGQVKAAIPHLRELVVTDPETLAHREVLARALQVSGDPDGAIEEFAILAEKQPASVAAWFRHAAALEERGRSEEAVAVYRQLLTFAPGHQASQQRLSKLIGGLK